MITDNGVMLSHARQWLFPFLHMLACLFFFMLYKIGGSDNNSLELYEDYRYTGFDSYHKPSARSVRSLS